MALGSREEEVRRLMKEHLGIVEACLKGTLDAVKAYTAGEADKARSLGQEVDKAETAAAALRRQVAMKLFEGAFLPVMREPLLDFVKQADRIADAAERVCETMVWTRVQIPEEFRKDITEMAGDATSAVRLLQEAFDAVFTNLSDVLDLVRGCTAAEHLDDYRLGDLVARIFSSDLPLAQKMQLHDLIEKIDDVADATEDAADVLETLTVITSV